MAIDYKLGQGESIPAYNARIAAANPNLPAPGTPVVSPIQQPVVLHNGDGSVYTPPGTTSQPTVGSIYGNDPYSNANQNNASKAAADFAINGLDQATQDQIRSSTLASFQAEIDAQNRVFADKLSQAKVQGAGRIGQSTAIQARRGLLGSDFGAAQTDTVNTANNEVLSAINNEKAFAIANINTKGQEAVKAALAEKTAAKQAGFEAHLKYLSEGATRAEKGKKDAAEVLLNNGQDPTTLDAETLQNLLTNYGITKEGLTSSYTIAKKAADEAATKAAMEAQAAEDSHLGSVSSIANTTFNQGIATKNQALTEKKFEEDKRQYGLDYALKQQDISLKQQDLNLKKQEAADGLSGPKATLFNNIVTKYNASPLVAAADRTIVLKNSIKNVQANPSDGATQLNLVYSYVQALDTYQSAVREGELGLVNSIDSKVGKLTNSVQQIQNGQIVRPEVAKEIAAAAQNLVDTISQGAKQKAKSYESQANTLGLGDAWKKYQSGFEASYNTQSTTQSSPVTAPDGRQVIITD